MKKMFALCLLALGLSACVMNEELSAVMPDDETRSIRITDLSSQESRSIPSSEFARISVDFKNRTSNLFIKVKSIQLCNIHASGTYHFPTTYNGGYWLPDSILSSQTICSSSFDLASNDSLRLSSGDGILFIPQTVKAWSPVLHPRQTDGGYISMQCQIFQDNTPLLGGTDEEYTEIAIPFPIHFQKGKSHSLEIVLEHGCSWYDISSDTPSRILNPITFGVSVEDWKESGSEVDI